MNQKRHLIAIRTLCISIILLGFTLCCSTHAEECGGTQSAPSGTIKSPRYAIVSNDTNKLCEWNIRLNTTVLQRVELEFKTFNMGGHMPLCTLGSSLEIFIGCSHRSIGRYCSQAVLPVMYSPDHCLKLLFRWDATGSEQGFKAVYSAKPVIQPVSSKYAGCGAPPHQENMLSANIYSPRWPLPYPPYVECLWSLKTRSDMHIRLVMFDFDIDSSSACHGSDSLEVRVGTKSFVLATTILEQHCGIRHPFVLDISADTVYIKFKTDGTGNARGFMAGVVTYRPAEDKEFNPRALIVLGVMLLLMVLFAVTVLLNKLAAYSKEKAICSRQKMRSILANICTFKRVFPSKRFSKPSLRRTRRTGSLSTQAEFNSNSTKDISDENVAQSEPKRSFDTKLVSFAKPPTASESAKDAHPPASFTCKTRDRNVHCTRLNGCAVDSLDVESAQCICSKLGYYGYSGAKTNLSVEFDEDGDNGRTREV